MSDPTTVNTTARNVDALIYAVVDTGFTMAKVALTADQPWLKAPIVSNIFDFIMGKLEGYIDRAAEEFGTNSVIDIQVTLEKSGVNDAKTNLKKELSNPVKDSAAIAAAKARFRSSLGALVHFDGTTAN